MKFINQRGYKLLGFEEKKINQRFLAFFPLAATSCFDSPFSSQKLNNPKPLRRLHK